MSAHAVVIGGGVNGMVAAGLLAREGRTTVLLEARETLGGLAAPLEIAPGCVVPGLLHDTSRFRPWVADALDLAAHGLAWRPAPDRLACEPGGQGLLLPGPDAQAAIGERSDADALAWAEWHGLLGRLGRSLARILDAPAPPLDPQRGDLRALAGMGLSLRRLGRADLTALARLGPMALDDALNDRFETDLLKGAIALPALAHGWAGPLSGGTTAALLMREAVSAASEAAGGPAALATALGSACRAAGVEVRTGARAASITTDKGGRVSGVALGDGEEIAADTVLSALDPRTTFLNLCDPRDLPPSFRQDVEAFRARGTTAAVHLALEAPVSVNGREGIEAACLATSLDEIERAFDAAKHRRLPEAPVLDIRVHGGSVISVLAFFVPHDLDGGWTDEARETLADTVVARLESVAPGLSGRIAARHVLAPPDIESRYGLSGGHVHHGEHSLDQFGPLRPSPLMRAPSTPVPGLFLAGAGAHPGGGLTGVPGALAARAAASAPRVRA